MYRFAWIASVTLIASTLATAVAAQEELEPILERGYVAHWLVCGPFPSDVPGGILGALQTDAPVLGDTDFMAGLGGIARTRPEHLVRVATPEGGEAIWQRAGTTDAELDLKPFFPSSPSGIAYAAFYTIAPRPTALFLDVQSPFGVRMWVNGFPAAEYEAAPLDETGVTQVVASLRTGNNLVVMEVPGADYEAMARALGISTEELTADTMANRPRLRKTSGFALSTEVKVASPLGDLYFVPELEDAGTVSGVPGDARQDTWFTLYNPADAQSEGTDVLVSTGASTLPELIEVDPIDPKSAVRVPVPVPVQGLAGGAQVAVSVRMHNDQSESAFNDTITVRSGADRPGTVRVVTGHTVHAPAGDPASESVVPYLQSLRNQLLFTQDGGGYGFDMGYPSEWHVPYVAFPDLRAYLLAMAQQGAVTVRAPYAPVDERLVDEILLWRNLQIGMRMDQGILDSSRPHYLAWRTPGIAPQSTQLLSHTPITGMISNSDRAGLPPLAHLLDLQGGSRYLRRKLPSGGPTTSVDVQEMAALQRRELMNLGVPSDVLVLDTVVAAPEPFYRGSVTNLARAFPRVVLDGGGGAPFFEEIEGLGDAIDTAIPPASVLLNTGQPGDLLTWPALKSARRSAAQQLATAETLATFACFHGATYPHAAMEFATRQLAFYSTPAYLSAPATRDDVLDTLAGYREVSEITRETQDQALAYIAEKLDTAGAVPLNQGAFEALVVFNPLSQAAALPVQVVLPGSADAGLTVVRANGEPVAFTATPYQGQTRLEFVAANLPSLGYSTYFFKYEGTPSVPVTREDRQIENEFLALYLDADTGAIAQLLDKRTNEQVNDGPLNQIVFLDEDESRNGGGRELWTSPSAAPASRPAEITSEHTAFRESILVRTPTRGGMLEQRYSLRAGQPWVECETRLEGIDLRGRVAMAAFDLPDAGRSFVAGERFGAVVGARGQADGYYRTQGPDNVRGNVAYPAHQWAALSPGDAIRVGPDGVVPWEPAIIVHGPDDSLERAARDLQAAFFRRGIPTLLHEHPPMKPDFLWTDATTSADSNDYLRQGFRMRVIIGSPDQNTFCQRLLAQLPAEAVTAYTERIPQGARLFLHDGEVPEGTDAVPTLILSGLTPAQSASMADAVTDAVRSGRDYLLPPSSYSAPPAPRESEGGCALLFPGSLSTSQGNDGRLLLGLRHRSELEKNASGARLAAMVDSTPLTYAIHPFSGSWREADVPAAADAAFARPHTAVTGIHPGGLPVERSYFGVSAPGLRLAGFKPPGYPQSTNTRNPFHPRDGVTLLAWETRGEPWRGSITGALAMLESRTTDVYDATLDALPTAGNTVNLTSSGFQIQPLWVLPGVQSELDGLGAVGRTELAHGPVFTRYWKEHRGAAPLQKLPMGVLLRGALAGDSPVVEAVISNHLSDKTIEGTARLSASSEITFGPQQFPFSLGPGRIHVEPIQIAYTPRAGADRGVSLEATYERQTYRDVLSTNEAPYTLTLSRTGAQLRAEIRNESTIHGQGYLDIIAAPQFWPEMGQPPTVSVVPRRAAINVPPFKSQTVIFTISDPTVPLEASAKLAANGTVQYQFFPRSSGSPIEAPAEDGAPVPPPPRRQ